MLDWFIGKESQQRIIKQLDDVRIADTDIQKRSVQIH